MRDKCGQKCRDTLQGMTGLQFNSAVFEGVESSTTLCPPVYNFPLNHLINANSVQLKVVSLWICPENIYYFAFLTSGHAANPRWTSILKMATKGILIAQMEPIAPPAVGKRAIQDYNEKLRASADLTWCISALKSSLSLKRVCPVGEPPQGANATSGEHKENCKQLLWLGPD